MPLSFMKPIFALTAAAFTVTALAVSSPASAQLGDLFSPEREVKIEVRDGYSRIVLVEGASKTVLTPENFNYQHPHLNGDWAAWSKIVRGAGQIERYHLPTGSRIQLTHTGTNINPSVSSAGQVAWEGWHDATWQIFLFNGLSTSKLTDKLVAINPSIDGDLLSFAIRDSSSNWRSVIHKLSSGEVKDVAIGSKFKRAILRNGNIIFANNPFPLNASDFFRLNLLPLQVPDPQTVSLQDIVNELSSLGIDTTEIQLEEAPPSATDSAKPSLPATPSATTQTPPPTPPPSTSSGIPKSN